MSATWNILVDEDMIIIDDQPSNRGSSVSPEPNNSPEGVILID